MGAFPDMLTFTPDCSKILVANEGRPGLDMSKQFTDPTGTVTIIQKNGFSEQTVDFSKGDGQYVFIPKSSVKLPLSRVNS